MVRGVKSIPRGPRNVLLFLDRVASYTRAVFAGMAACAVEHGPWRFVPVVAPTALISAVLRRGEFDGILARVHTNRMSTIIAESGIPAVDIGHLERATLPTVTLDDVEVGRIGARHLLQAELPNLAYCGVSWNWYNTQREIGFVGAAQEAGRVPSVCGRPGAFLPSRAEQYRKLDEWIAGLPKPVGIMATDDVRAREVLESCGRLGLRVPDDVAVVGAGNDPLTCEISAPPLSSVAIAADRVGYEAARLLAHLMDGQPPPSQPTVLPPVGMVVRFSTKARTSDDADVAQAIEFIRDQVHAGISVEDVLRVVPLSRRTLEMRFRSALGRSPAEEIRRVRIERAKRLLVETDTGMAGVAQASGFSSANQLCETFRREAGVSPTRYRRQFRAG